MPPDDVCRASTFVSEGARRRPHRFCHEGNPVPISQGLMARRGLSVLRPLGILQIFEKRTISTSFDPTAVRLAHGNGQCMKFIEKLRVPVYRVRSKGQTSDLDEGLVSCVVATWRGIDEPVAFGDPCQILVGNGNGMLESIDQNRIGGLRPYPRQVQKALTQIGCRSCCQRVK